MNWGGGGCGGWAVEYLASGAENLSYNSGSILILGLLIVIVLNVFLHSSKDLVYCKISPVITNITDNKGLIDLPRLSE